MLQVIVNMCESEFGGRALMTYQPAKRAIAHITSDIIQNASWKLYVLFYTMTALNTSFTYLTPKVNVLHNTTILYG